MEVQLELGAVQDNCGNLGDKSLTFFKFYFLMMSGVTAEGYSPSYFLYPREALWAART